MTTESSVIRVDVRSRVGTRWQSILLAAVSPLIVLGAVLFQALFYTGPATLLLTVQESAGGRYGVSSVSPGGVGWDAGVRPGDVVVSVEGGTVKTVGTLRQIVDPTGVTLMDASSGSVQQVQAAPLAFSYERGRRVFWTVGLLFALSASFALLVRAWDRAVWVLYVLLTAAALLLAVAPISGLQGGVAFPLASQAFLVIAVTSTLWFTLALPGYPVSPRERRLAVVVDFTGLVALVGYIWAGIAHLVLYDGLRAFLGLYAVVVLALSIARLVRSYRGTTAPVRRSQIAGITMALFLGFTPGILLVVLPSSFGVAPQLIPVEFSVAMTAWVPFGITYAVLRYQLKPIADPPRGLVTWMLVLYAVLLIGTFLALLLEGIGRSTVQVGGTSVPLLFGLGSAGMAALGVILWRSANTFARSALGMEDRRVPVVGNLRQIEQAREEERRHLATELHDGPIQTLTVALGFLEMKSPPPPEIMARFRQATGQLRMIMQLGAVPVQMASLVQAMEMLAKSTQELSNIAVSFNVRGADHARLLSPENQVNLYHILQEALANITKHAHAKEVVITLDIGRDITTLTVADNGDGFVPAVVETGKPGHFGLAGMRWRAEMMGGTIDISSKPGSGTTVRASIPTR
ncbi:MAG: hypothetical protein HY680_00620 [Chloroflexi bacterium]|nr:hypothetical protein [Chloroflexota bacterium]